MKELVVISGKGGTGKTSLVASLAALAEKKVLADCDVDAADLHLVLAPQVEHTEDFSGGKRATIVPEKCNGCGRCHQLCRFDAIQPYPQPNHPSDTIFRIDGIACEGCGVCAHACPQEAITFKTGRQRTVVPVKHPPRTISTRQTGDRRGEFRQTRYAGPPTSQGRR